MRKRNGAGAAHGIEISQAGATVQETGTDGAKSAKVTRNARDRDVVEHPLGCRARRSASQAIQLPWAAVDFAAGASPFQECSKLTADNEMRPGARHRGKARLYPIPHCLPVDAVEPGDFLNRVTAVDLGPARIKALTGHGSSRPRLDEAANVLDAPSGDAGAELDGAGIAAGLDAGPPSRARYWDRSARRENSGKPDEAGFG